MVFQYHKSGIQGGKLNMNATPLWSILVGSIFTNNILFASFLGMCSFLVCSNRISTAIGLGSAVTFVLFFTTIINYVIYHFVLIPLGLEFLSFIIFIAVIAAFVQFVEMFVERFSLPSTTRWEFFCRLLPSTAQSWALHCSWLSARTICPKPFFSVQARG